MGIEQTNIILPTELLLKILLSSDLVMLNKYLTGICLKRWYSKYIFDIDAPTLFTDNIFPYATWINDLTFNVNDEKDRVKREIKLDFEKFVNLKKIVILDNNDGYLANSALHDVIYLLNKVPCNLITELEVVCVPAKKFCPIIVNWKMLTTLHVFCISDDLSILNTLPKLATLVVDCFDIKNVQNVQNLKFPHIIKLIAKGAAKYDINHLRMFTSLLELNLRCKTTDTIDISHLSTLQILTCHGCCILPPNLQYLKLITSNGPFCVPKYRIPIVDFEPPAPPMTNIKIYFEYWRAFNSTGVIEVCDYIKLSNKPLSAFKVFKEPGFDAFIGCTDLKGGRDGDFLTIPSMLSRYPIELFGPVEKVSDYLSPRFFEAERNILDQSYLEDESSYGS